MMWKDFFLNKKIKNLLQNSGERQSKLLPWEAVKRVIVLSSWKDRETVTPCLEQLSAMGKTVVQLVYVEDPKLQPEKVPQTCFLTKDKLSFWGFPQEALTKAVVSTQADLLIDLSVECHLSLLYLALLSSATCKVGPKRADINAYDFTVDLGDKPEIPYLFGQLLDYMKLFQLK